MIPAPFKKWAAFGRGIGIEIAGPHGSETLRITAVRVRPNGARVLARLDIEDFPHQPAGVWGTEYANFTRKLGLRHLGATVILPRREVIVRQLSLTGVSDKDLPAAVGFQLDGLHPYPEDEIVASWSRLSGTPAIAVAIVRRAVVERYATLFAEAGIKLAGFTCSATAIYSALRLFNAALPSEILAIEHSGDEVELYGESPTRPLFSASFPSNPARESGDTQSVPARQSGESQLVEAESASSNSSNDARAASLACAELRIRSSDEAPLEPRPLEELLHAAPALPYAAALASACPRLSLALNLLPAEQRQSSSRALWIPTAAVGAIVLLLAGALAAFPGYENRKYMRSLEAQIATVQPLAKRAEALDRAADAARLRTQQLDDFRRRSKADMDVLEEMTHILPPPTWLTMLEINRGQISIAGEADQAATLLKTIDASPLFKSSEFMMPPVRTQTGEMFRIRTNRESNREVSR
jgi:Tfp pilus assembly protein PilN